jgi:cell division protein FtsL
MTKAIAQTYNVVNSNIKTISYLFLLGSLALIFMYAISIFSLISSTVALQKVEAKITSLNTDINQLDSRYLVLSGTINPDDLSQYGMSKGKVSQYISRSDLAKLGILDQSNHVAFINER